MEVAKQEPTLWDRLQALVAPRMGLWLWLSIALAVLIWFLAPHMVKVSTYKLSNITIAAYLGYWLARALEGGRRPHELEAQARAALETPWPRGSITEKEFWGQQYTIAHELRREANQIRWRRVAIVAVCIIGAALGS
jgi:hypothetical protein